MNFTSSKYLYPHIFTLSMVRCTVQKVGRKYVDFHGNRMCLYLHPNTIVLRKSSENWSTIPSKTILGGRALKLHFQLRQSLEKLHKSQEAIIRHCQVWISKKSQSGLTDSGQGLERTIDDLEFTYENKSSSQHIYEQQYQGLLKASSSLLSSWCIDPLSLQVNTRQ